MKDHRPKPGRMAFVCGHKDHTPEKGNMLRVFAAPDDAVPECASHGKMTPQANRPYNGEPIPAVA